MESFITDLVNNIKVRKPIRYGIVMIVSIFIIAIGIVYAVNSPFVLGKYLELY